MNFLDILVIIPALWGAFKGFKNGLISEGSSIAALILGIWAAVSCSDVLGSYIQEYTSISPQYQQITAFAGTFILVIIACYVVTRVILAFAKVIKIAWLDKVLGIIFGMSKFLIVIAILFFLANSLIERYAKKPIEIIETSIFFKPLAHCAEYVIGGEFHIPHIEGTDSINPINSSTNED